MLANRLISKKMARYVTFGVIAIYSTSMLDQQFTSLIVRKCVSEISSAFAANKWCHCPWVYIKLLLPTWPLNEFPLPDILAIMTTEEALSDTYVQKLCCTSLWGRIQNTPISRFPYLLPSKYHFIYK